MVDKEEVFKYCYINKDPDFIKDKVIEEMSELTKEIIKSRQNSQKLIFLSNIAKEFADTRLMMRQLEYCYNRATGNKFSDMVNIYEQYKCDKIWAIWHNNPLPKEPE